MTHRIKSLLILLFILSLPLFFTDNLNAKVIRVSPGENNVGVQFQAKKPGDTFTITVVAAEGYILVSASLDTKESSGLWIQQGYNFTFTASKAGTHNLVVRGKLRLKPKPGPGVGPGGLLDFTLRAIATYYVIIITPAEDTLYAVGDLIDLSATVVTATGETVTGTVKWTLQGDKIGTFPDGNRTTYTSDILADGKATTQITTDAIGVATLKAAATISIEGGTATAEATTGKLTLFKVEIKTVKPAVICLNKDKKIKKDVIIKYKIEPPKYTASTVQVEILEDDKVIETLEGSKKSGTGKAKWPKGSSVSGAEPTKKYAAQVVINKGESSECYSEKVEIKLLGPWIIDKFIPSKGSKCNKKLPYLCKYTSSSATHTVNGDFTISTTAVGAEVIGLPLGGEVWSWVEFDGSYTQEQAADRIKVMGSFFINDELASGGGQVSTSHLYVDIKLDDGEWSRIYYAHSKKTFENENFTFTKRFKDISEGKHHIYVKFQVYCLAFGEDGIAIGLLVAPSKLKEIVIECGR